MTQSFSELLENIDRKLDGYRSKLSDLEYKVQKLLNSPAPDAFRYIAASQNSYKNEPVLGKACQAIYKFLRTGNNENMRQLNILKTMETTSGESGGYLVPAGHLPEIIQTDGGEYVSSLARHFEMNEQTLKIPKLSTRPSVSWLSEGETFNTSEPVLDQIELKTSKLGAYLVVNNELLEDSRPSVAEWLDRLFRQSILEEIDNQMINGDGSVCSGILTAAAGHSVIMTSSAFSSINPSYLSELISKLPSPYLKGSHFIMHKEILHFLRSQKDDAGNYIFRVDVDGAKTIYGIPVALSDLCPSESQPGTAFVCLANLARDGFLIGTRRSIQMSVDPFSLLTTDQTRIRWSMRVAMMIGNENLICRLISKPT